MQVKLAAHAGFCFGVKRAIQMALEASDGKTPIYTVGPLIHSPQMVQELKDKGIIPLDDVQGIHDSTVIIRSHGIPLQQLTMLEQGGNIIINATCPYVKGAQDHIKELCRSGFPIIILGDKAHPEVVAMKSYCSADTLVLSDVSELPDMQWRKVGVISQTTKSMAMLTALVDALVPRVKEMRLHNTICTATSLRQEAAAELAHYSDLMIVIGGRNSSNTRMLRDICAGITTTIQVETADELSLTMISGKNSIGLAAGASTPDRLIVEVFNRIYKLTGDDTSVSSVEDIPINKEDSC